MKNVIMVVLVILSLVSAVYGIAQEAAAKKILIVAQQNLVLAEQARKEADANAVEAQKQAEIARSAKEELEKCCKAKK